MNKYHIVLIIFLLVLVSCKVKHIQYSKNERQVLFAGGNGSSKESAVVIKYAKNTDILTKSETEFLEQQYGTKNQNWKLLERNYLPNTSKGFDILKIQTFEPDTTLNIFFDLQYFVDRTIYYKTK